MKAGHNGTDLVVLRVKTKTLFEESAMDDYLDELLELRAAEQDLPEPAEDAFEL